MNRTRLLLIGFVALALGAIVSFAVYRALQTRAAGDAAPGVDVVVAANDVPVGAKVEEKDVKLVRRSEMRVVIDGVNEGQEVALSNPTEMEKKKSASGGALQSLGK